MPTFRITGGVLTGAVLSDNYPDQGLPPMQGPVDPGYGISIDRPAHPIVIPPGAIGPGLPSHPIYLPVYPAHPIVIPPDSIGPGLPSHPIYIPVYPSHPIVIPPDAVAPGYPAHPIVLPEPPLGIWGGPWLPPYPSHPIVIPPEAIVPDTEGMFRATVYYNTGAGLQRITFSGQLPTPTEPTEPEPKAC